MSSVNRDSFTFPFQFGGLESICFTCLLWPDFPVQLQMLVVNAGTTVLFPKTIRFLPYSLSPLSEMSAVNWFSCRFFINALYHIEEALSVPSFLSIFIAKGCWILSNMFSVSIEMIYFFHSINVMCYIDWFSHVDPLLHSWHKSHLVMVYNPFNVLLDSVY